MSSHERVEVQGDAQLRVAIVGGGWAGLAAAVELASGGVQVTVFESARQLGGRARSVDVGAAASALRLDNGQHILIGAYRETLRLMREVGADPERLLLRRPLELHHPGSAAAPAFSLRLPRLPAPWHLALGLLGARGVSLAEKIAAARFMRRLEARRWTLPEDESVAALLQRERQGPRLRRYFWEPLCLSALNTPAADASAQVFVNVLRDSLAGASDATDLLLPATDLDRVFAAPAAAFVVAHGGEIRLASRVRAIEADGAQWLVSVDGSGDEDQRERFDQVVVATGAPAAARLLAPWPGLAAPCAALEHAPIGTLYLGYPPAVRLPLPMLGLEQAAALGQWVFDRGQLCGTAGVLAFVFSGSGAWEAHDADELARRLHRELESALGRALPTPTWRQLIRERRATFVCRPGLARPGCRTGIPGLWLAGDFVWAGYPSTLEGAVRSGVAAAHEILRR